jgi:predicted TIM-barrel fold metal-dependent hydrolase
MMISRVIDTHIHIFEKSYSKLFNNMYIKDGEEGELFLYEQYRKKFNITDAFVICHEGGHNLNNNNYVKRLSEKLSWIHPFGYLYPNPLSIADNAKHLVEDGCHGVSMYPGSISDIEWLMYPSLRDFWRFMEDWRIPISINISAAQCKSLKTVLELFPNLMVLISHMGRPRLNNGRLDEEYYSPLLSLSVYKNIYVKLSGFYAFIDEGWRYPQLTMFCAVDKLKEAFGIKRLLYASDFAPVLEYNTYQQALELLKSEYKGFTLTELEDIYYNNAYRILETGNKYRK